MLQTHDHSSGHGHPRGHGHDHGHGHGHGHTHGPVDPAIAASAEGIRAVKWSLIALLITGVFQVVVVWLSGSVALLADTIHNFADATTSIPLWIAFALARRRPDRRFTYGYGRVEDLAGMAIVGIITFSAVAAGWQAVQRIIHPQTVEHLWAVVLASVIGYAGNEAVARYRIRIGRRIQSAALVADGQHARMDAFTSLAVLLGALGIWLGVPAADPVIGMLISLAIARIAWDASRTVLTRALDGVDPRVIDEIRSVAGQTPGVEAVAEVRARWVGHRLHAELNVAVDPSLTVGRGHAIARDVQRGLVDRFPYLATTVVHVDPANESGEAFHRHE